MIEYAEKKDNTIESKHKKKRKYHGRPQSEIDALKEQIQNFSCSIKSNSEGPCLTSIDVKTIELAISNLNAEQVDACILTALSDSGYKIFDIIAHYGKGHSTENFFKSLLVTDSLFSPSQKLEQMRSLLISMSTTKRVIPHKRPKFLLTAEELAELASC